MKNKSKKHIKISNRFSYKKLLLALVEWNDQPMGCDKWWENYPFSYNDLIRIANLKLKRKPD